MKAIYMSLYSVLFITFAACGQVESPTGPDTRAIESASPVTDDPAASSSVSEAIVTPASLTTCLHQCQPDDLDCVDCCHCLARGGTTCCM